MKSAVGLRRGAAIPAAVFLSLVLAGQAMAATWSPAMALTSTGIAFPEALATDGAAVALALYSEHDPDMPDVGFAYRLKVRRSANMGTTWAPPLTLAETTINADIAMRGDLVDVVWDSGASSRTRYRRSSNEGVTFSPAVFLSPRRKSAWNPSVGHGPNGVVAVAWENLNTQGIKVRVSSDDGATWGPMINLATAAYDMGLEVAVGNGVIYVAYVDEDFNTLVIQRSTNEGATWSGPMPITGNLYSTRGQFSLTAIGSHAYVAYAVDSGSGGGSDVKFRRSTNSGATWSAEAALSPVTWSSDSPDIALQGGVLRAVFERRTIPLQVIYRQSTDGVNWSPTEVVNSAGFSASVGYAGKAIALFRKTVAGDDNVYVSTRTP